MRLSEIVEIMENIAPPSLAEEWDNVGVMVGLPDAEISKILVSLDLRDSVLNEAIEKNADLIITHHPLIFKPLKNITSPLLHKIIRNNICVYSAHTNLDVAANGVNDILAELLNISNAKQEKVIQYGKVEPNSLAFYVEKVKSGLNVSYVKIIGDKNKIISKIAVVGGSGGDFINDAKNFDCDLLVTGEVSYHDALLANELDLALIIAGHFEIENPVIYKLTEMLKERLPDVEVTASEAKNKIIFE